MKIEVFRSNAGSARLVDRIVSLGHQAYEIDDMPGRCDLIVMTPCDCCGNSLERQAGALRTYNVMGTPILMVRLGGNLYGRHKIYGAIEGDCSDDVLRAAIDAAIAKA